MLSAEDGIVDGDMPGAAQGHHVYGWSVRTQRDGRTPQSDALRPRDEQWCIAGVADWNRNLASGDHAYDRSGHVAERVCAENVSVLAEVNRGRLLPARSYPCPRERSRVLLLDTRQIVRIESQRLQGRDRDLHRFHLAGLRRSLEFRADGAAAQDQGHVRIIV